MPTRGSIAAIAGTDRGLIAHAGIDPPEGGLTRRSFIMTDQVRTISASRLARRLGAVDVKSTTRARVETCSRRLLGW